MMRHIFSRSVDWIILLNRPYEGRQPVAEFDYLGGFQLVEVGPQQIDKINDLAAILDRQGAVHIAFAHRQTWVPEELVVE